MWEDRIKKRLKKKQKRTRKRCSDSNNVCYHAVSTMQGVGSVVGGHGVRERVRCVVREREEREEEEEERRDCRGCCTQSHYGS